LDEKYTFNMIIKRRRLSDCISLVENFPVVGIANPRQVGKTFFVNLPREHLTRESIYL